MKRCLVFIFAALFMPVCLAQNVLSDSEASQPLDSKLVYDLFERANKACEQHDGQMLFDQFSKNIQQYFIREKQISPENPSFDALSYFCKSSKEVGAALHSLNRNFCSVQKRGRVALCSYDSDISSAERHGVKITFEGNELKFDEI